MDTEDVFESSLHVLFDEAPIAFGSAGLDWTYHPPPSASSSSAEDAARRPIVLRLPSPAASCTSLQAHHVWSASIYWCHRAYDGEVDAKGKRVVELGAGGGLGSVVCGRLGAEEVVATDYPDEDILSTLKLNLSRNLDSSTCSYAVEGLEWGKPLKGKAKAGSFDIVLALDLLWQSSFHAALLDSIFSLLSPDGRCIVVAGFHSGRRVVDSFVELVKARGGRIEGWKEVRKTVEGYEEVSPPREGAEEWLEELRQLLVYFEVVVAS